jgi:hypothetical protein
VWIEYFRENLPELAERLRLREVVMHPFVVGELACGNTLNRGATPLLERLHSVTVAERDEVTTFIRTQMTDVGDGSFGSGSGFAR